jgi:hypothetical protein
MSVPVLLNKETTKTIPISEYRKLSSYVLQINELCNEHHEKFNSDRIVIYSYSNFGEVYLKSYMVTLEE